MAALDLLGRRWTLRVIWELGNQPAGFRELRRRCDEMSSSVLSQRLRELTEAGITEVEADGVYRLTALGRGLEGALLPLQAWSDEWERTLSAPSRGGPGPLSNRPRG